MPKPDFSKCLSNEQFAEYLANQRAGVVLGDLDDHIEGCGICNGRWFFIKRIKGSTAEEILANWPKSKPKDRARAIRFARTLTKPKRRRGDEEEE
ncbi:hypothetical protein EPO17_00270 [Patescibacteria group bacterium]|nr:MAG: hypothetical protein EPO17_00270 [Patescibacteria group bacterium]